MQVQRNEGKGVGEECGDEGQGRDNAWMQTSRTKIGRRPGRKEHLRENPQKNMHWYLRQRESLQQTSIESEKESKTGVLGKGIERPDSVGAKWALPK